MMRKLIGALALASAAVVAAPASATTFVYDINADSDSIVFGNSKDYFKGFTDHFLFDITQSGYVSAFVGSFALAPSLDVYLKSVLFDDKPITKVSSGGLELWTLNETAVGPGRHTIKVTGYYGQKGGSYAGTFNFGTSSAVPEPATWAMMIMGFGLAGVAMRRQRKVTVAYS
jgi:hypothetical protein